MEWLEAMKLREENVTSGRPASRRESVCAKREGSEGGHSFAYRFAHYAYRFFFTTEAWSTEKDDWKEAPETAKYAKYANRIARAETHRAPRGKGGPRTEDGELRSDGEELSFRVYRVPGTSGEG